MKVKVPVQRTGRYAGELVASGKNCVRIEVKSKLRKLSPAAAGRLSRLFNISLGSALYRFGAIEQTNRLTVTELFDFRECTTAAGLIDRFFGTQVISFSAQFLPSVQALESAALLDAVLLA